MATAPNNASPFQRFRNVAAVSNSPVLFWLAENAKTCVESTETQNKLRQIIMDFEVFDDYNECVDYLTDFTEQKAILIVSEKYGRQIVSMIHDIHQLWVIFIYDLYEIASEGWFRSYRKVKGIFTQSKDLIAAVAREQRALERTGNSAFVMDMYNPQKNTSQSEEQDSKNVTFMYFQILVNVVQEMTSNDAISRQDLIVAWKEIYAGNKVQEGNSEI
ncbi:hypothetical protein I4U23_017017 [Adineta vaga]|nr:hypothetical protein I4U23_017017 [Adineta vaga]